MRVVNVMSSSRPLSYASPGKGGRTLQPGEESPELPLERIHSEAIQRDLAKGTIQLRLSKEDTTFLNGVLKAAKAKICVKKPTAKPKPAAPPKPTKAEKEKAERERAALEKRLHPGTPDFERVRVDKADAKKGAVSLSDLGDHNRSQGVPTTDESKKSSLADVQTHTGGLV